MTPEQQALIDELIACQVAYEEDAPVISSAREFWCFFPKTLIDAVAAVGEEETDFWEKLTTVSEHEINELFEDMYPWGAEENAEIPQQMFAPIKEAHRKAVAFCAREKKYGTFLQQHEKRIVEHELVEHEASAGELVKMLESMATLAIDEASFKSAIGMGCPLYTRALLARSAALREMDLLKWAAISHARWPGYNNRRYGWQHYAGPQIFLFNIMRNRHVTALGQVMLRDILAMHYMTSQSETDGLNLLKQLNVEVVAGGHKVPRIVHDTLLICTSGGNHGTGKIAAALGLGTADVIAAHLERAKTDREYLTDLCDMAELLDQSQWEKLILTIVSDQPGAMSVDETDMLAAALAGRPVGALSPILDEIVKCVSLADMHLLAPVLTSNDLSVVLASAARKRGKQAMAALLDLIEALRPEVRAAAPRSSLVKAFASGDVKTRNRAFQVLGLMTGPGAVEGQTASKVNSRIK